MQFISIERNKILFHINRMKMIESMMMKKHKTMKYKILIIKILYVSRTSHCSKNITRGPVKIIIKGGCLMYCQL